MYKSRYDNLTNNWREVSEDELAEAAAEAIEFWAYVDELFPDPGDEREVA